MFIDIPQYSFFDGTIKEKILGGWIVLGYLIQQYKLNFKYFGLFLPVINRKKYYTVVQYKMAILI